MAVVASDTTVVGVSAGPPGTYDSTGYAALTYTTVGEVVDVDPPSTTYSIVEHRPLADRLTTKLKGGGSVSDLVLVLGKDLTDAGQVILQAGNDGAEIDTVHSFKITEPSGDITYTAGLITGFDNSIGSADTVISATVTVAQSTKPVLV